MGGAAIASAEHQHPEQVQQDHKKTNKDLKGSRSEWKQMLEDFHNLVIDQSFVSHPIRATTVHSALQYSADSSYLLPGTHKHLGGAYDPSDGCIYGVPANSKSILCLYHDKDDEDHDGGYRMKTIPLPERVASTRFKWLRGIFAHGYLWAIPSWADCVLCVDVDGYWGRRQLDGDVVKLLDLPKEHVLSTWQWHGAGINPEKTAIYCIPSNAHHVLKVDLITKTTSFIDIEGDIAQYPDFDIKQTNKWYGGIPGSMDGCVYGIPYRSCAVLQINTRQDIARLVGPNYKSGNYFWHGGINVAGKIYAHPSHANTVLVIDTNHDCDHTQIYELPIQFNHDESDGDSNSKSDPRQATYKWLGGAVGQDGNIYCPACDTSAALRIDTTTGKCETFGFAGTSKNKWQGGMLSPRDGCIYCIPASGQHVLRICTTTQPPVLQLLGNLPAHKDKWQGGHVGLDGNLYFIPENGYRVLKVTPATEKPHIDENGRVTDSSDVRIEFL